LLWRLEQTSRFQGAIVLIFRFRARAV